MALVAITKTQYYDGVHYRLTKAALCQVKPKINFYVVLPIPGVGNVFFPVCQVVKL